MSLMLQALNKISYLARKADVVGTPRISITFDTPTDGARFEVELKRDMHHLHLPYKSSLDVNVFVAYGIEVRILT